MPNPVDTFRSTPSKWQLAWRSLARLAALSSVLGLLPSGCDSGPGDDCGPGGVCSCSHQEGECFLACYSDDCQLACDNLGTACGTVCFDHCQASCNATPKCSHSCGDGCTLDCHDTNECAGTCGRDCSYKCYRSDFCGVRVGPGSHVTCSDMGQCWVECEGACAVTCTSINPKSCHIKCLGTPDKFEQDYDAGTYECP